MVRRFLSHWRDRRAAHAARTDGLHTDLPSPSHQRPSGSPDIEEFARAVVHDLRTPLTALSGEVELTLRRERSAGEYREALGRIGQSISDLVGITQDLALLTRTTGILDPHPTAHLNDILASILSGRPPEGSGGLRIDEAIEPAIVAGDGTLLARALSLLVDHALRHRREGGTVHIRGPRLSELVTAHGDVALIVGADAPGFRVPPWRAFATEGATPATDGDVRLRIAVRIVQRFGGSIGVPAGDQGDLAVCLRRAGRVV